MFAKLAAPGFRTFSRFGQEMISRHSILIPNVRSVCFENELTKPCCIIFTRNFCNERGTGSEATGLLNVESSVGCDSSKKHEIIDGPSSTTDVNSSNDNFLSGEDLAGKLHSKNLDNSAKDKFNNNVNTSKHVLDANEDSNNLTFGVQTVNSHDKSKYPSFSRFHLPSDWRKKHLGAQGIKFPGEVYVIRSIQDELQHMDVMEAFLQQKVLGFDTEHCPVQHLVCVVQLATHEKAVLWQCLNFKRKMPHYLKEILTGSVNKVGHACMDDAIMISKQFKEEPRNLIDTNCWARDLHCSPQSLQGLCAIFLDKHLSKTHQQSNWKKDKLSPGQIKYAATDAWMSLKVYEEMKRHAEELGVALTPMYNNLQERYEEVVSSRRLKRRRRRQRVKEKRQELKAKTLQQMTADKIEEQISNPASMDMSLKHVAREDGNFNLIDKDSVTNKSDNEFLNTIDPTAVGDPTDVDEIQKNGTSNVKKSIGSRQRHKRFLAKFHSLE